MHIFTNETELSALAEQMDLPTEKLSATLNLDLVMRGDLNRAESITGFGNFQILGEHLWSTPLFKELENVSFVTIEGMDNLLFNRASGSFNIGDNHIYSEDSVLSSRLIDILIHGKIGFDKSLNLKLLSRFSSGLREESFQVGGFAPAVMNIAENKITQYRVTGTLDDPVYKPIT